MVVSPIGYRQGILHFYQIAIYCNVMLPLLNIDGLSAMVGMREDSFIEY